MRKILDTSEIRDQMCQYYNARLSSDKKTSHILFVWDACILLT